MKRVNWKIVVAAEMALIPALTLAFYIFGNKELAKAIATTSIFIIVIPTVFCGLIGKNKTYDIKREKSGIRIITSYKYDLKTIVGIIVFFIGYGLVFAEKISVPIWMIMVIASIILVSMS